MVKWLLDRVRRRAVAGQPPGPRNAYCSFCRRGHTDVGPLAEGPDLVFILGGCVTACGRIIEHERIRLATGAVPAASGHPSLE